MASVLVYWDERDGPSQVWTLPADPKAIPRTAWVPGGPFGVAQAHVMEKAPGVPWQEWAEGLERQLPYTVSYYTETVPDSLSVQQALDLVRQKNQDDQSE